MIVSTLGFVLVVGMYCVVQHQLESAPQKIEAQATAMSDESQYLSQATGSLSSEAAESYQLFVAAQPRLNPDQTFSPPADSIVITNQEQLDLLVQATRPQSVSVKQ